MVSFFFFFSQNECDGEVMSHNIEKSPLTCRVELNFNRKLLSWSIQIYDPSVKDFDVLQFG